MKRKGLFTTLVVLSVLTLLAWAWSYVGIMLHSGTGYFAIISGSFDCTDRFWPWGRLPTEQDWKWRWALGLSEGWPTKWVPHYEWEYKRYSRFPTIVLPLWIPFVLFATYPAVAMIRTHRRRKRQRAEGCCSTCGYDLRGNVSGICPECGTKIVVKPRQARASSPSPRSEYKDRRA